MMDALRVDSLTLGKNENNDKMPVAGDNEPLDVNYRPFIKVESILARFGKRQQLRVSFQLFAVTGES